MLAAYSTSDLSNTALDVISIYGSKDEVLNFEKYEQYKDNLPLSVTEIEIAGGFYCGKEYG